MCAVICRKATFTIPDANPLLFEHKIWVFVRELLGMLAWMW